MRFEVTFVPSADQDLDVYPAREQRIILDAILEFLEADANVESKRRKKQATKAASAQFGRPLGTADWGLSSLL